MRVQWLALVLLSAALQQQTGAQQLSPPPSPNATTEAPGMRPAPGKRWWIVIFIASVVGMVALFVVCRVLVTRCRTNTNDEGRGLAGPLIDTRGPGTAVEAADLRRLSSSTEPTPVDEMRDVASAPKPHDNSSVQWHFDGAAAKDRVPNPRLDPSI